MTPLALIIIGRNEAANLPACFDSIRASRNAEILDLVYVDSHSSDNSVELARAYRAQVVPLDPALPFTAARARNAGAQTLLQLHPETPYLQFLDADTELDPDWLARAADYLDHHPRVAAVSGRLREKNPAASPYNLLADMEWNAPPGNSTEFGGNVLLRASIFHQLHGFNPAFIAGEEPELAARMRLRGYQIQRLSEPMATHDIAMFRFPQWFRRTLRSGHAIAQLHRAHGRPPLRLYQKPFRSTLFWPFILPLLILALALLATPWFLLLLPAAYIVLFARIARHRLHRGDTLDPALLYALFTTLAKFPQLLGLLSYHLHRLQNRPTKLIEYKTPSHSPTPIPEPQITNN